ncbi:hypothetical protein XO12_08675 [Marinitoga sp. 1154]|uniref:hypothetical protein n=1 Tax=Marinitoga sp. 1154 TaxID=1643335 RepID=UPI0015862CE3|nr:hypothetical protein [Marinitoga sp. 1154]NUV00158.1 hypothetical protein [Marinitoga sp. 1154]
MFYFLHLWYPPFKKEGYHYFFILFVHFCSFLFSSFCSFLFYHLQFVVFSKYKWLYFNEKKYNELSDENFKIAEDFEKIKNYIFNSIEYKYFNYISFAWTFIEFDVELLKYIFDRKEIFIKESEGEIETLVILSEYLQKNNTLSISFISGDIETALDFSIYQYLKKEKSYLNIMIPEELHIKNKFLNKGFLEEDNEKTNVLLYVLE